jgi:hypothetical protein
MAGNARFHDKLHSKNHHTLATSGFPDSGNDPIASPDEPFQGDFVINGSLSTNAGLNFLSANIVGDFQSENLIVRDTLHANFLSGQATETIISDGALTGYGNLTMTMDFRNGIYAKTPTFIATNNISAVGAINSQSATVNTLTVNNNATVNGNLFIAGNLSAMGDVSVIETNIAATSSLSVNNVGPSTAFTVNQQGAYNIASFKHNGNDIVVLNETGVTTHGAISSTGNINSPNINNIQSTSGNWNSSYNSLTSTSANWDSSYSSLTSTSANWNSVYNSVSSTSANWNNTFNVVNSNSANWINVYNSVNTTSANWDSSYSSLTSTSANWNSVYNSVSSTSANWNNTFTFVNSNSANLSILSNAASIVSSNSANWDSSYNSLTSTSANWNSVTNTVSSTSGQWLTGNSTITFVASNINVNGELSANTIHVYNAIHVSVSSVTLAPAQSAYLSLNSPSYNFITVSELGTLDLILPNPSTNNKGIMFYIKNLSNVNNYDIHIHNHTGSTLTYGGILAGTTAINKSYTQVVWDGTTWQTLHHV